MLRCQCCVLGQFESLTYVNALHIWWDLWWRDFLALELSFFATLRVDLEDYFKCMT